MRRRRRKKRTEEEEDEVRELSSNVMILTISMPKMLDERLTTIRSLGILN